MRLAIAILLLSICPAAFAQEPASESQRPMPEDEVKAFFGDMAEKLKTVDAVVVPFEQERRLAVFQDVLRARGMCAFQRPDRLRWEMAEPYRSLMLYDGKSAARYEWAEGAWKQTPSEANEAMGEVLGRIASWMRGDFSSAREVNDMQFFRDDDSVRIVLTPRSEALRQMIRGIRIRIDSEAYYVRRVTILEPGGDETDIRFGKPRVNPTLAPDTFRIDAPAEVLSPSEATTSP